MMHNYYHAWKYCEKKFNDNKCTVENEGLSTIFWLHENQKPPRVFV